MNINLTYGCYRCQNSIPSACWSYTKDVLLVPKPYPGLGVGLTTCHLTLLVTKVLSSTIKLTDDMGILMPTPMSHRAACTHQAWTVDIYQKVTKTSSVPPQLQRAQEPTHLSSQHLRPDPHKDEQKDIYPSHECDLYALERWMESKIIFPRFQ